MHIRFLKIKPAMSLLIIAMLVLCVSVRGEQKNSPSKLVQSTPKHYQTIAVNEKKIQNYYQATGSIESTVSSQLSSQITAIVNAVYVSPNQHVKKGQVLIMLDNRDLMAQVSEAQQVVKATQAGYKQNQLHFARIEKLIKPGYVSQEQLDNSKTALLQSQASLIKAKHSLEVATVELSYCEVKAPSDGVVLNKLVNPGDQATPGKSLLEFRSNKGLRVSVSIPEELANKVKIAEKYTVKLNGNKTLGMAVVEEIIPSVNYITRSFTLKAAIKHASSVKVYPGMYAKLLIPLGVSRVVTIPSNDIITVGQLKMVRILTNNTPERIYITTGRDFPDGFVEVLSGLNSGDKIIVTGGSNVN
jgi:HlyD family secretion protein